MNSITATSHNSDTKMDTKKLTTDERRQMKTAKVKTATNAIMST